MSFHARADIELIAARHASRDPKFAALARKGKALVDAEVARVYASPEGKVTGAYAESFGFVREPTKRGVMDYLIFSADPQAHIIEWGHVTKDGGWEPGKFVFTRALQNARAL